MNSNIKNKAIAITGASSGIGEAIARHLAAQEAQVALGARRQGNFGQDCQVRLSPREAERSRWPWT
jgi:NADP-dependent 3-hydroxy acid dehydrogenase YdfG